MIQGTANFETEPFLHRFPEGFYATAVKSLWSEFESLASALAYLHDECKIVHSDIKPSNILLYEGSGLPPIIAKPPDFGLAFDLQTKLSWRLEHKKLSLRGNTMHQRFVHILVKVKIRPGRHMLLVKLSNRLLKSLRVAMSGSWAPFLQNY